MPFSFIEIEERKTRLIFFFFIFLVLFYFFSIWVLSVTAKFFFFTEFSSSLDKIAPPNFLLLKPTFLFIIFLFALVVAGLHWYYSTSNIIYSLLTLLQASPPDKEDRYHRRLENIVEEVSVATGGKNFECAIIPTSAMNAFSIADFKNRAVIGVTEGIISRLTRAELEAIVAHEAAHIVSQDTVIKSVIVSIFGIFGFILKGIRKSIESSARSSYKKGFHPYIILLYIMTAILYSLSKFISLFISRQCEYRADAVAVRLTREPLSLAQGLYRISKRWRGNTFGYEHLESLFIMNPNYSQLDEEEGCFANLFSTHPPAKKRIDILLNMAHSNFKILELEAEASKKVRPKEIEVEPLKEPQWHIVTDGKWQGPFLAKDLIGLGLLRHESFVRRENEAKITLAYEDPELLEYLRKGKAVSGGYQCPRCYQSLVKVVYEGATLYRCQSCQGVLVEKEKMARFLSREEQGFSEEVIREAKAVKEAAEKIFLSPRIKMANELQCPKCKIEMYRNFYTLAYPIEVDRCFQCHFIWFDRNEFEVLQYLMEESVNF